MSKFESCDVVRLQGSNAIARVLGTDDNGMRTGFLELEMDTGEWMTCREEYVESVYGPLANRSLHYRGKYHGFLARQR